MNFKPVLPACHCRIRSIGVVKNATLPGRAETRHSAHAQDLAWSRSSADSITRASAADMIWGRTNCTASIFCRTAFAPCGRHTGGLLRPLGTGAVVISALSAGHPHRGDNQELCRQCRARTEGEVGRFNGYPKSRFLVPLAAALDGVAEIRAYGFATALAKADVCQWPLADGASDGFPTCSRVKVSSDPMRMVQRTEQRASLRSNSSCRSRSGDATNPNRT